MSCIHAAQSAVPPQFCVLLLLGKLLKFDQNVSHNLLESPSIQYIMVWAITFILKPHFDVMTFGLSSKTY